MTDKERVQVFKDAGDVTGIYDLTGGKGRGEMTELRLTKEEGALNEHVQIFLLKYKDAIKLSNTSSMTCSRVEPLKDVFRQHGWSDPKAEPLIRKDERRQVLKELREEWAWDSAHGKAVYSTRLDTWIRFAREAGITEDWWELKEEC